jgi:hypothetical protein
MKLNAEDVPVVMAKAHDEAIIGPRSLLKRSWHIGIDYQRVIADHLDSLRDSLEQTFPIMGDYGDLSVHRLWSPIDLPPESQADPLVSQADAENRFLATLQDLGTYSKILCAGRMARAGRNNNAIRIESLKCGVIYFIVTEYGSLRSRDAINQIAHILCEGIIVID